MLSIRYEPTEVDRRTWLHMPSWTLWSTINDTHLNPSHTMSVVGVITFSGDFLYSIVVVTVGVVLVAVVDHVFIVISIREVETRNVLDDVRLAERRIN